MSSLQELFDSIIEMDKLEERASFARLEFFAQEAKMEAEMLAHAKKIYLASVDMCDEPHDIETLSLHIESAFPDVADTNVYDKIAEQAIKES